jgi:hypothetical protein
VPALQDHRAAVGADAQDGGGALPPGGQASGAEAQFLQQTPPPAPQKNDCFHLLHYSKDLAIFHLSSRAEAVASWLEPEILSNVFAFSFPRHRRRGRHHEIFFLKFFTTSWYEKSHSCKKTWETGKSI